MKKKHQITNVSEMGLYSSSSIIYLFMALDRDSGL